MTRTQKAKLEQIGNNIYKTQELLANIKGMIKRGEIKTLDELLPVIQESRHSLSDAMFTLRTVCPLFNKEESHAQHD